MALHWDHASLHARPSGPLRVFHRAMDVDEPLNATASPYTTFEYFGSEKLPVARHSRPHRRPRVEHDQPPFLEWSRPLSGSVSGDKPLLWPSFLLSFAGLPLRVVLGAPPSLPFADTRARSCLSCVLGARFHGLNDSCRGRVGHQTCSPPAYKIVCFGPRSTQLGHSQGSRKQTAGLCRIHVVVQSLPHQIDQRLNWARAAVVFMTRTWSRMRTTGLAENDWRFDDFCRLSCVDAHAFDGADSSDLADRWLDVWSGGQLRLPRWGRQLAIS